MPYLLGALVLFAFVALLYFGYRDDFRRNPRKFIYTTVGVLLTFCGTISINTDTSWLASALCVAVAVLAVYVRRNVEAD